MARSEVILSGLSHGTETTVHFCCPCGLLYRTTLEQVSMQHSGVFECQDCAKRGLQFEQLHVQCAHFVVQFVLGILCADAQRLELPFACPCFSLAWARKNTAGAADIGIAGLFIVGIAALVIDHDRFAACLAGMMMFRCSGCLD